MNFQGMISQDPGMLQLFELIKRVAMVDSTVLIQGDSGTGKELVAAAIHAISKRADEPFVAINCGALPETLLESELFGHERGAFTGADRARKGIFEQANGGSLFLDEIGDTTPALQIKLLRVLQHKRIRMLGGDKEVSVDVRIVSATNTDLKAAVQDKSFREDLFYRLNAVNITLPPLRERIDDVPLLAQHFLEQAAERMGLDVQLEMDKQVVAKLLRYSWPGNIRELEHLMEAAAFSCCVNSPNRSGSRHLISMGDLPMLNERVASNPRRTRLTDTPFYVAREEWEREYIEALLRRCNFNFSAASRMGKISRKSLLIKARRYDLVSSEPAPENELVAAAASGERGLD